MFLTPVIEYDNSQKRTCIMEGWTASTEYDVPYHGSIKFVCPSNFFDSQNILKRRMEDSNMLNVS
jgi:hypothetical protein